MGRLAKKQQLSLPLGPVERVRHGQVVTARPEDEEVYRAVLAMRKAGHRVFRAGADHLVDGDRRMTSRLLVERARRLSVK